MSLKENEEIVGICSECKRKLTAVYYGVHRQDHMYAWNCLCFLAGSKALLNKSN